MLRPRSTHTIARGASGSSTATRKSSVGIQRTQTSVRSARAAWFGRGQFRGEEKPTYPQRH
eukprot:7316734-Lingulodinium_polyedra.AAC.1